MLEPISVLGWIWMCGAWIWTSGHQEFEASVPRRPLGGFRFFARRADHGVAGGADRDAGAHAGAGAGSRGVGRLPRAMQDTQHV